MENSTAPKRRVIIVGGGVAGLTAGATLIKNGNFEVTLLEADSRIGGRVQSLKLGDHFIENGAQWVHGDDHNSVCTKAKQHDLLDNSRSYLKFDDDSVFVSENGDLLPATKHKALMKVLNKLMDGPDEDAFSPEQSLGSWSQKVFWEHEVIQEFVGNDKLLTAKVLDWQQRFQNGIDGCDSWFDSSCRGQLEYWECPGNPLNAWKPPACYASLLNLIVHGEPSYFPKLMPDIPPWILLNKDVVKIDYGSGKEVAVTCKDGSVYQCDHVICTVSLGVLKERVDKLFVPSLPEKNMKAIQHLSIGCVNKLHFDFPSKWWPDEVIGFNLLWDPLDVPCSVYASDVSDDVLKREIDGLPVWCRGILGFYVVASHPTALNAWTTGPTARLMENLDDEEVKATFMMVMRKFLLPSYPNIPEPTHFVRSKWFSNPFTRGSYSFRSVDTEKHNVWSTDLASPVMKEDVPILCFAGEATHVHFYSTVHGAHDSGLREANRLINFAAGSGSDISPFYPYTPEMFSDQDT